MSLITIWQLTWNDMNLHHHTSLPQFRNMLLPHFFLVYTFYTIMFPSFYPAPHDLRPAKRPKMRFCVASIRRMLSSRRTCRWHADGAMVGKYLWIFPSKIGLIMIHMAMDCILVGGWPTPLKNSQLGWLFPIYVKIKNVPNHQPVYTICSNIISSMFVIYTKIPYKSLQDGAPQWCLLVYKAH